MQVAASAAVRAAEQAVFASGRHSSSGLMAAVIRRLSHALDTHFFARKGAAQCRAYTPERIIAYLGRGNNAGDAIGLAASYPCPIILRGIRSEKELSADAREQFARLEHAEIRTTAPEPEPGTLIIDGLLGSGASGALRPEMAALVRELNELRAACPHSLTLAIDIPTGLQAEGKADIVKADITCPIGCVKPSMLEDGAEEFTGQLLPIPLPEADIPPCRNDLVADADLLHQWLPRRNYTCFKNRAGRVAVIAGSAGMLGAAQMAAEAALAAGAGLVVLYSKPETYALLATRTAPEIMVRCVASYANIDEPEAQALLIGPGLGHVNAAESAALLKLASTFHGTVVLDADALNTAAREHWKLSGHPHWVLTPHPGEMRRLAPKLASLPRRAQVERFLADFDGTLVLKGARSLIASPGQCIYNSTGGPFMANGGQGDVLAGCIAALAAQGLPPLQAAAAGAYACGLAATQAWQHLAFTRAVRASQTLFHLQYVIS